MTSTPVCRRDGLHVGIQLFGEVLEHSIVGCANDGGQHECGCHHVCNVVGRHKDLEAQMLTVQKLVHVVTTNLLKM